VLSLKHYSEKSDVYSLAIVLWELFSGEVPFQGWSMLDLLNGVCKDNLRPKIPIDCPPEYAELIEGKNTDHIKSELM